MLGIDRHLILTLERSVNRQWMSLGAAAAMQTPIEKISFIKGHDHKRYQNNMKQVANAAEADGFPFAHHFAQGWVNDSVQQSASGVCQVWNFARILRHIALGSETCLVTWDDRFITIPFPWLEKITTQLQMYQPEFYLWQLRIRFGDSELTENERICYDYPELVGDTKPYLKLIFDDYEQFKQKLNQKWVTDFEKFREAHYKNPDILTSSERYIQKHIQTNRLGYDESMVISPTGAAWLLLQALNMKELTLQNEPDSIPFWESAICRRTCFDAWMSKDLDEPVKEAIKDGKGIYCPKQIGYKYVQESLPMGSDVEWANTEHPYFDKKRTIQTDINFLEIP